MGGLSYPIQRTQVLVGSKDDSDNLTETTLESTYDGSTQKAFATGGFSHLSLSISYTMGSGETSNSIEFKLEASPDRSNWYQLTTDSTSSGTSTVSEREWTFTGDDAATDKIDVALDISYEYMRFEAKESGVGSTKGSVFVEATLSGK